MITYFIIVLIGVVWPDLDLHLFISSVDVIRSDYGDGLRYIVYGGIEN